MKYSDWENREDSYSCENILKGIRETVYIDCHANISSMIFKQQLIDQSYRRPECFFSLIHPEILIEEDFIDIPVKFDLYLIEEFQRYFDGDTDVDIEKHLEMFVTKRNLPIAEMIEHGFIPIIEKLLNGPYYKAALYAWVNILEKNRTYLAEFHETSIMLPILKKAESSEVTDIVVGIESIALITPWEEEIFESRVGPLLIKAISSSEPKIVEVALWSIRIMIKEDVNVAFKLLDLGMIHSLLSLSNAEGLPVSVSRDLLKIWEILFQHDVFTEEMFDDIYSSFLESLLHPDLVVVTHALINFARMSNEIYADKLIEAGILDLKPFLLNGGYSVMHLTVLENLIKNSKNKPFLDAELLQRLKKWLETNKDNTQLRVLRCLFWSMDGRKNLVDNFLNANLLPRIVELLEHENIAVQLEAFALISRMAKKANKNDINKMIEMNVICPYATFFSKIAFSSQIAIEVKTLMKAAATSYMAFKKQADDKEYVQKEFEECGFWKEEAKTVEKLKENGEKEKVSEYVIKPLMTEKMNMRFVVHEEL